MKDNGRKTNHQGKAGNIKILAGLTIFFLLFWGYQGKAEAADYSADGREVFRIIEVIPHDACSVFPYLIDWKSEEEYNRNVPIGYEGILFGSSADSGFLVFENKDSNPSKPYQRLPEGMKSDFLDNYDITFTTQNTPGNGYWWRKDDTKEIKTGDGYFEYVGENKGLYYINFNMIAEENGSKNGIRHEMKALARTGKENGQGEYEVKGPRYYWADDYDGKAAYPTDDIESRTAFNYDISFEAAQDKAPGAVYRVYHAEGGETADPEGQYDYFAKLTDETEDSLAFRKYKGGNYINKNGVYQYAGAGKGSFIIDEKAVASIDSWITEQRITFEYAGKGKGAMDVSFIYAGETAGEFPVYAPILQKVTDKKGRYALTSTTKDNASPIGEVRPVYEEKTGGDYSRIITRIDCANVDYTDNENGFYATTKPFGAGVRIGRMSGDNFELVNEVGGWVFHEIDNMNETEYTKLKDVKGKSSFKIGDRIYVEGQKRAYRYFCRNSFVNNEWFKLLCYLENPEDPNKPYSDNSNGQGFDPGISSSKNLNKAKPLLDSFNSAYRIEIVQRTPGELTVEEVEEAELIYIADTAGIEGMTEKWNAISSFLENNGRPALEPLPDGTGDAGKFRFSDDLSNDVLLAIYDRCIYKNEGALMVNISLREHYMDSNVYNTATKNLGKVPLFMDLMEDARDFAYFIEGYDITSDKFCLIHNNDGGDVLGIEVWPMQEGRVQTWTEQMYNVFREGDEGTRIDQWDIMHFRVPDDSEVDISWKGSGYTGNSSVGSVREGETKYYSDWYAVSSFNMGEMHKIWQIIHNRKGTGKIVVEITNAELTYGDEKKKVIYADEFDPESFLVNYKISRKGASASEVPALADTKIYFDDNDNQMYDEGEEYYMNTNQNYLTENEFHARNVRTGFEDASSSAAPKLLNPDRIMRKVLIEASDTDGKTGTAVVWVAVRAGFNLN